jgi:hypothetical protein
VATWAAARPGIAVLSEAAGHEALEKRKRGGRKLVLAPDGTPTPPAAPQIDSTLVKAIARALRWRKMLETGLCLLKTRNRRASVALLVPRPYRRGHDHASVRPWFPALVPAS